MNDPSSPTGVNSQPFTDVGPDSADKSRFAVQVSQSDLENSSFSFFESVTVREEAKYLSAYLSAAYGLSSGDAAYQYAYERKDTEKSIFVVIQNEVAGSSLDTTKLQWASPPPSESVDDSQRLRQFLDDYGSHYLASINYGYRISIRGALRSTDEKQSTAFKAAFKAAFGSFNSAGGISQSTKKTLTQQTVDLRAEVVGALDPPHSFVLTSYDQIVTFLNDVHKGQIKITRVPVSANARSYWHTLVLYPNTRSALSEVQGIQATAPWGVPRGTVLPWVPQNDAIMRGEDGETFSVPEGWAVCDGQNGTPDLRGQFLRGTSDFKEVKTTGGAGTHRHKGRTGGTGKQMDTSDIDHAEAAGVTSTHRHAFETDEASSLPPYAVVIYIMKL
jgi:hypothetical protein